MLCRASIRCAPRHAGAIVSRTSRIESRVAPSQIQPAAPRIRQCLRNSSTRTGSASGVVGTSSRIDGGERRYNTATAQASVDSFDESILLSQFEYSEAPEPPAFDLTTHDPSSVLILDLHKGLKASDNPTNVTLATFEACVRVDRLARAQVLLLQLSAELANDSPALLNAHNLFLQGLIKRLRSSNSSDMTLVFRWFDEKVVGKYGIKGNSTTFVHLLTATLGVKDQTMAKNTARFYVNMWVEEGHQEESIFANPMLSKEDAGRIRELLGESEKVQRRPLPSIRNTESSGSSISILNQSLDVLTDPEHGRGEADFRDVYKRQEKLEERSIESALAQWKAEAEQMTKAGVPRIRRTVGALLWQWQEQLVRMIEDEIIAIKRAENTSIHENHDRIEYGPFFSLLSPEKVAATVLLEIVKLQRSSGISEGMRAATAVATIGDALELEYQSDILARRREALPKAFLAGLFNSPRKLRRVIKKARETQEMDALGMEGSLHDWPLAAKMKIGGLLLSMVIKIAHMPVSTMDPADPESTITEEHPVFYHTFLYLRGRRVGIIKSHTEFAKFFTMPVADQDAPLHRRYLPMVAPPRPWLSFDDGGYLATATTVMRTGDSSEQKQYLEAASQRGDLDTLFRALDVLGKTAWTVNHEVFDVFVKVWNTGEALADIPPAKTGLVDLPPAPPIDAEPQERARWSRDMKKLYTQKANDHSQRCDTNLRLVVARAFLNETFYFPHNVDFRGRAYPIPPHFNHIGNDLCRGLLLFGKGKELGESGLRWLKVHLANVFGYDKASFSEREQFANDHMEDILDSANNPLDGKRWWLSGEGPWQTLAACYALKNAHALPDPTKYVCHQHVAMDGSCNGLQHYAALGGDEWGAKHVNLAPSDKPQDIYTGVMDIVNAEIEAEAKAGHPEAKLLQGRIVRKTVKQTVMTYVYGVTYIGARAQIDARLKDDPVLGALPTTERMSLAANLTHKTLKAVRTMFYNASELQRWLVDCATRISKSAPAPPAGSQPPDGKFKEKYPLMNTVVWTTPLGLPVVQPYRKSRFKSVITNIQKLHLSDPTIVEQVLPRKQAAAFPPNFIHSLDATHMLLSALKCHEVGLDFAAVHDSFWTHPSDVDTMNRILRDAFISVHCRDITNEVREEFKLRYNNHFTLHTVFEGSPACAAIKAFRKETFGKETMTEEYELHLENSRMLLLNSEDPALRKQGEEMRTPYSILLEYEPDFLENFRRLSGSSGSSGPDGTLGKELEHMPDEKVQEEIPAIDVDAHCEGILEDAAEAEAEVKMGKAAKKAAGFAPKKKVTINRVHLWVPLVFPRIPTKGAFNLNKLKDSLYFFS